MEVGKLGVWYFTENMPATAAAETAQRIEELGYSTLWIPETVGRHPLAHAAWLLAHTKTLNIATGIASIYNREPGVTVAAQHTLAEQSDDRFLLGMGVSHIPLVEGIRGLNYGKPVATMRKYLEGMDASLYIGPKHEQAPSRVIAALGPKMLELARDMCTGAHPYFTSPDHTVMAREILGADPWLCVEQKVIFETDPAKARELARDNAKTYIGLPNYRNNWLRMGLSNDDFENGGSDKFIDTTYAWGDVNTIKTRVNEHFQAGASHVCVQPVNPNGTAGDLHWHALEELRDTVA